MCPLYEYQCEKCGAIEERLQKAIMPPPICSCGKVMNHKISSVNHTFGFRLSDESMWVKGHKDELVRNI